MTPLAISGALVVHRRRAMLVAFVRAATVAVGATLLTTEVWAFSPALLAALLAVAALYAWRQMPTSRDAARRIDASARLQDLLVTAVEREPHTDAMSGAIARTAVAALTRVSPSRAYPFEPPRHWRRWAVLVAGVQVIAIALAWRAPGARPTPLLGTGLSIPGSGGATASAPAAAVSRSTTPPAATAPAPTPAGSVVTAPTGVPPSSTLAATGNETADGNNRYRQAAARATDALGQRRVPAARRGVVERYFIAIRPQGK